MPSHMQAECLGRGAPDAAQFAVLEAVVLVQGGCLIGGRTAVQQCGSTPVQ